jgi:DNA-binding PadR family transcriptional regulator
MSDVLAVSVLALLAERPMHPYEMYRLLIDRHDDRILKVRPGSLYHVVDRLSERGLVEPVGTDRAGGRPERTTYRIAAAGRAELAARLRQLIAEPVNEYPRFPVGLAEAHNLPRAEVVALLDTRIAALAAEVDEIDTLLAANTALEAYTLAAHHVRALRAAEVAWLRELRERIDTKELEWPHEDRL